MPRFAANLSMLFAELPYLDRFAAASAAGFKAVEVLFPYEFAAKETQRALLANGLELLLINAPPPNYAGGDPGYAAVPKLADRFQRDIRRVMRYADMLKAQRVHVMAGPAKGDAARATYVQNLQMAADSAPHQQFTIEPLNSGDFPGYFLDDYNLAVEILDEVDRDNVTLQFDAYHAQLIHGDALKVWEVFGHRATHVQFAAAPSRCEPGRGALDFDQFFAAVDDSGYTGWVSAEYTPSTLRTEDSLRWMRTLQAA